MPRLPQADAHGCNDLFLHQYAAELRFRPRSIQQIERGHMFLRLGHGFVGDSILAIKVLIAPVQYTTRENLCCSLLST